MDKYKLITGTYFEEDIGQYTSYGIQKGELLIEDISTDRCFVLMFVDLCNKTELSTIHLKDAVLDWIG